MTTSGRRAYAYLNLFQVHSVVFLRHKVRISFCFASSLGGKNHNHLSVQPKTTESVKYTYEEVAMQRTKWEPERDVGKHLELGHMQCNRALGTTDELLSTISSLRKSGKLTV